MLHESLGECCGFVRIFDWNFESEPCWLECEDGGEALQGWATPQRLAAMPRNGRIAFFLRIAATVEAAHGVGVLHKDIKPANVLVDAGGQPRLADFGNSRLLQPERLLALGITATGMTLADNTSDSSGTPLYLAPELLAGHAPTVRSDVYALGVLLYQWLAGDLRRPLAPGWEREIDDSLLVQDIARATDGDPARRLGSVGELIQRLEHLPERHAAQTHEAEQLREQHRLRQTLERTRARRPWLAATFATLLLGLVASAALWRHSEQQRELAQLQAARAEAVVRFLGEDLLGALSPGGAAYERDPGVRELLQLASQRLEQRLDAGPATLGSLHAAIGDAWRTIGEREQAARHLRQSLQHYKKAFGERHRQSLTSQYQLVRSLAWLGKPEAYAEAETLLAQADTWAGKRLQQPGELALAAALARGQLAFQQLQIEPSLLAHQRADALQRQLRPDDAMMAALIRSNLADAELRLGRSDAGIARLQAMLADPLLDASRIGESAHAGHQIMLARALRNQGQYAQALALAAQASATSERVLGADHYSTLIQLSTLASIHDASGDCPEALAVARTVRQRMADRYGAHQQGTLVETGNLGFKEYTCGDREAGLTHIAAAERGLREHYGENNVAAHSFRYGLARALVEQKRWGQAQTMLGGLDVAALTAGDSRSGWEHRLQAMRGEILIGRGEVAEGSAQLAGALSALQAQGSEDADELQRLQALLAANPA
ncbi:MAG: tetratricopeptide repeat protein [Pseudomonadota bacterium]|nr:tetratricopeptide repeat protein [Pseudomonadota bacterium]